MVPALCRVLVDFVVRRGLDWIVWVDQPGGGDELLSNRLPPPRVSKGVIGDRYKLTWVAPVGLCKRFKRDLPTNRLPVFQPLRERAVHRNRLKNHALRILHITRDRLHP